MISLNSSGSGHRLKDNLVMSALIFAYAFIPVQWYLDSVYNLVKTDKGDSFISHTLPEDGIA